MVHVHLALDHCNVAAVTFTMFWAHSVAAACTTFRVQRVLNRYIAACSQQVRFRLVLLLHQSSRHSVAAACTTFRVQRVLNRYIAAAALRKDHSFFLSLSFCILRCIFFFESSPFFSVICSTDPADFVFTSFFHLCLVINLFEEVVDIVLPSLFWSSN